MRGRLEDLQCSHAPNKPATGKDDATQENKDRLFIGWLGMGCTKVLLVVAEDVLDFAG